MDYGLLRRFDAAVRKYYLRLKEIAVAEKYGRIKAGSAAAALQSEYYEARARWVGELVAELEALEVPAYDFHACRDNFVLAGRALRQAFCDFPTDATAALRSLSEYGYYQDIALAELKDLWERHHGEA